MKTKLRLINLIRLFRMKNFKIKQHFIGYIASSKTGSILIWSVLLGFALTSVFFFYSIRQRATIAAQRDTAEILDARSYLESYADYVQKLAKPDLDALKEKGVGFDNISGTVTNIVDKITGAADIDVPVKYKFSGEIFIEWNKKVICPGGLPIDQHGDLIISDSLGNDILYKHDPAKECQVGQEYDDVIGPIAVTDQFEIKTLNVPFYYEITAKDASTELLDNQWNLDIKTTLDYGKLIEVKRSF